MADVRAPRPPIYGLLAEFTDATSLTAAARRVREAGYRRFDAFTPFPIEELTEAMDFHDRRLPLVVLLGGLAGTLTGLGLQYWVSAVAYPLNVGGRPYLSWPSFIPVAFETTILFAALSAVLGMVVLNGLPMPYHPVFNAPRFALASRDRFFLLVEATDPKFDQVQTKQLLGELHAREVTELAH
jgi:hypothetical protein